MSGIRYLDLDSSYRNRNEYPSPCDFVVPHALVTGPTTFMYNDAILESAPYTGSLTLQPGELKTRSSPLPIDVNVIYLDLQDINIDNYYINNTLQISGDFRQIVRYDGAAKTAIIDSPFGSYPTAGTVYLISKVPNYFNSNVSIVEQDGTNVTKLSILSPLVNPAKDFYNNSYIRYTNGTHVGDKSLITQYEGAGEISAWNQPDAPGINQYISTSTEQGFLFRPIFSGFLEYITMNLSSSETVGSTRSLVCKIRKGAGTKLFYCN